jgi:hypothetical protein
MRAEYEEPITPSSTPLVLLREQLEEARVRGEAFGPAWPAAVEAALDHAKPSDRREWKDCLESTRSTWERCYLREPATRPELALVNARGLIDREAMPDRSCEQCGNPIGDNPVGRYCGRKCSVKASEVVQVAPFGTRRGPMQQPQLPLAA